MRILVIGGTGFIGPRVVTHLCRLGHRVTVFHRGVTEADLPIEVKHLHGPTTAGRDRAYFADFTDAFDRIAADVVLDMIPITEADARQVVELFRGKVDRIVAISSQDVYRTYGSLIGIEPGPVLPTPLKEDAPLRERLYPYRGQSPRRIDDPRRWMDDYEKILVERVYMGDVTFPGTILRLPMVYGPGDRQHRLFEHLKRMDDRRPAILIDERLSRWR